MIQLRNVLKRYRTPDGKYKVVADHISATFPTGASVGLLGRNGAGKTTLMQMIGGTISPEKGEIYTTGTISWPVGFAGSFHGELTGAQNTRFVARVYGVDTDELIDFVQDFAELGSHFYSPVRTYSAGMRSRLAFGISIGIPFQTYLVDEVTSVGDAAFKKKSQEAFLERMETAGAIVVSHSMAQIKQLCTAAAVLENGVLHYFQNVDEAIAFHQSNMDSTVDED